MSGYPMIDALNATHPLTPREKVELKPCPFCGSKAEMFSMADRIGVRCVDVMCAGSHRLPSAGEDTVALWNRRTSLASGSGDHADLARLARIWSDMSVTNHKMPGDTAVVWSRRLEALLAENAALRGERDQIRALHHRATDRSRHWEIAAIRADNRATEAERKLAEAVSVMDQIREAGSISKARDLARVFISKEAERG